jgi:hypothetical protein
VKKIFKDILELQEFKRDLKALSKKFKILREDLNTFINVQLKLFHKLNTDNKGIIQISNLGIKYPPTYKARKFACRSLKGEGVKSGIRIIYAYYPDKDKIEFIEIYYKGIKENEDKKRILSYYTKPKT